MSSNKTASSLPAKSSFFSLGDGSYSQMKFHLCVASSSKSKESHQAKMTLSAPESDFYLAPRPVDVTFHFEDLVLSCADTKNCVGGNPGPCDGYLGDNSYWGYSPFTVSGSIIGTAHTDSVIFNYHVNDAGFFYPMTGTIDKSSGSANIFACTAPNNCKDTKVDRFEWLSDIYFVYDYAKAMQGQDSTLNPMQDDML